MEETRGLFRPSAMNGNGEKGHPCADCQDSPRDPAGELTDALNRVHRSNMIVSGTILWAFIFVGALYVWKARG